MTSPDALPADVAAWTDEACRAWLWRLRFSADGATAECPSCGCRRRFHRLSSRPSYSCDVCGHQIAPTSGTLFAGSSTSLAQWFRAVLVVVAASEEGEVPSSRRLAAELGVGYGTARRMRARIEAALATAGAYGDAGNEDVRILRQVLAECSAGRPNWASSAGTMADEASRRLSGGGSSSATGHVNGSARVASRADGASGGRPRSATRERILAATCDVIVEKGMAAVRVSDIARAAGLSTAIIHYHFATKDDVLLEAVVWQNQQETERRAAIVAGPEPALERLWRFFEASMPPQGFARAEALIRYDLWGRAMREPAYRAALEPLRREWRRQIAVLLEEGVASGTVHTSDPLEEVLEELTAILDGYSLQYLLGYEWMTAERLWELLRLFVARRLGAPAA